MFGVEMWKVTLSKSDTTWSIEEGVALWAMSVDEPGMERDGALLRSEAVSQQALDEHVLIIKEKHDEGCRRPMSR